MTRVRVVLVAFFSFTAAAWAQDARGTITGRITDSSGAVMPLVDVRAVNVATGVAAGSRTTEAGSYRISYLIPGRYTVQAEIQGFKKFVRENVQVRVNETVELNIEMAVGNVAESVEVHAETPLLSTAEASLGQVVDERRVLELPLFAGNAMDLVHLAPGTVNGTDMRLRKAPFNNAPSQFSTDGSGNYGNEFTIDGVSNTYSDGTSPRVAFSPPSSSISEFKIQTSTFDASVGHTTGSLVNVSTKSGGNDFHGQAYWWLRHSKLDAPTIFQNRSGQKLPIYQDNRYGLAGGGPVTVPKVYSGKNRTFWFWAWEANKFGDPNVGASTSTVPRDNWRNGDFSDLLKLGANYQLYDPATIRPAPNGRYSRQPLAGNILPASRIHPMAKKLLALWPSPNAPGTPDGRNNFFLSGKALEDYWTTIGRIDHAFSQNHRMFLRLHRDYWQEDKNRSFGNDVNGIILNRINRGIAVDDVYVFNPAFIFNFRYGITQQEFPEHRVSRGFDLASLGFSQNLVNAVDKKLATVPRTSVGSLTTLSNWESGDGVTSSITHSVVGNFTWLKSSHSVKFGPEFRVYREFRNRYQADVSPQFSFSAWGRGPLDTNSAPPVGAELLSLLLGIPGGSMSRSGSYAEQDKYFALYVQDDWKVSRKLTVNLGLRVEHESPITERYNRSAVHFVGSEANPIEAQAIANYAKSPIPELPVSQFKVKGGYTFAGVAPNGREYWNGKLLTWMPRIGLAYQVRPRTVLRAGYGIFYGSIGVNKTNSNLAGFSRSTPITATNDNGVTWLTDIANPFPTGLLPPLGAQGGLETNLAQGVAFFADNRVQPYAQRWSFGFQHQLPGGYVLESAYVGNRTTRLPVSRSLNYTPREYLSTTPYRDQATINYLAQSFPSPFFGLNPNFTGRTISRGSLLQAYPQFGGITFDDPVGYSWYHSLQTRVEKRLTKGYTVQLSHTWSKTMQAVSFLNASDPMPYRSISDLDRAQRFTGSAIWELPFGKGRHWFRDWNRFLNGAFGGWQLSSVAQWQSGAPLGFGQALFIGDSSTIVLPKDQRGVGGWFNTAVFNRNSAQQLGSNINTSPLRYSNIRADRQMRWDLLAIKNFKIRERLDWQFRAECYNVTNTPVLRGPNTSPTSSAFGTITAQEPPRSWQFSLKLQF